MSSTRKIVARLAASGVVFPDGDPVRAHYKCRGQEANTWLVRRVAYHSRVELVDRVRWETCGGVGSEGCSSGHEMILDLPAGELASTPCLVGYNSSRDLWDLHLTSLDGFASMEQKLLGVKLKVLNWIEKKRPLGPIGKVCLAPVGEDRIRARIVGTRYFGQPDVDPLVGVRVWNQSHGVEWLRLSQIEIRESDQKGPR